MCVRYSVRHAGQGSRKLTAKSIGFSSRASEEKAQDDEGKDGDDAGEEAAPRLKAHLRVQVKSLLCNAQVKIVSATGPRRLIAPFAL